MDEAYAKRRSHAVVTDIVYIFPEIPPVAASSRCGVKPAHRTGFQSWFRWRSSLEERLRQRIVSGPERVR